MRIYYGRERHVEVDIIQKSNTGSAGAFTYFILHLCSDNARAKSNYRNVLHSHENTACALKQVGAIDKGNSCAFNDTQIPTKGHTYTCRGK